MLKVLTDVLLLLLLIYLYIYINVFSKITGKLLNRFSQNSMEKMAAHGQRKRLDFCNKPHHITSE